MKRLDGGEVELLHRKPVCLTTASEGYWPAVAVVVATSRMVRMYTLAGLGFVMDPKEYGPVCSAVILHETATQQLYV
jgi:hypothetical protein